MYARLFKALKIVTVDFKQSLSCCTKLYNLYPDTEHAKYLRNIYARLSDEKNTQYYYGKVI